MTPLFCQAEFTNVVAGQHNAIRKEVDGFTSDYLAAVSDDELMNYLVDRNTFEVPAVCDPYIESEQEIQVDVRNDWRRAVRDRNKPLLVPGHRIEIRLPFSGLPQFFNVAPSSWRSSVPPEVNEIGPDYLSFIFEGEVLDSDQIRQTMAQTVEEIRRHLQGLKADCDVFNAELRAFIRQRVDLRKKQVGARRSVVEGIGLPLKHRDNAPETYSVPSIKRKPEIQRPVVTQASSTPEPTLADQEYENILTIIRSMVSVMERSPRAFIGMGEEDLRTHFLVQLNGQYQGRATGETFNFQGKTDILIREGDRNVFIAECKIWKGEGELVKAVDQILSYLHWRDTKTALMIFNRNRSFSDVLAKVVSVVQGHKCCKRLIKKVGETEWRFLFHNPDDSNRELQLAVMLFDIPKEAA